VLLVVWTAQAHSVRAQPPPPGSAPAAPQGSQTAQPPPPETPPLYENTTPRGAFHNFLAEARRTEYEAAATHLDLTALRESDRATIGPRLARQLQVVLDRTNVFDLQTISDEPEGNRADGLSTSVEKVGSIESASGDLAVTLRRVRDADGSQVWKFSPAFIERVPALYDEFGYGLLGEMVPQRFRVMRFGGLEAWQWFGFIGLLVAAWFVGIAGRGVFARVVEPIVKQTRTSVDDRLLLTVRRPVRWIFVTAFLASTVHLLRLSSTAQIWVNRFIASAAFATAMALISSIIDGVASSMQSRLEAEGQRSGAGAVNFVNKLLKLFLICIAAIGIMQALGYNVTGLLAGLGIGGIAVALAAQKTIENLFGGVTLMTDQPVRIGELCRFGGTLGWVEEFRFRSTRIRTLDRSVLSIPNGDFSNAVIENLSVRDRFRLWTTLRLRCDTTPAQLRQVLASIRTLLADDPRVDPQPLNVRLIGFGESSLDIEIATYVLASVEAVFLTVREELLLRIMDIVAESGTALAMPSRTLYMAAGNDVDPLAGPGQAPAARGSAITSSDTPSIAV
jgi:MscS family membrane protein